MGGAVAETVEAVNPCAECGYDLGPNYIEAYDGNTCPECGTPFERVNVTPEPRFTARHDDDGDDDDDDELSTAELILEHCPDTETYDVVEYLSGSGYWHFEFPENVCWDDVHSHRLNLGRQEIYITWNDGSESTFIVNPAGEDIDSTGDYRIQTEDGDIVEEC